MQIGGLQKMTLLDYPGRVACTVFLPGCNFRCPFCHNAPLVLGPGERLDEQALFAFLEKRRGLLDGVAVTGGEPLLQPELETFLRRIKALGYPIKLDTNGSFPDRLRGLLEEGLVDYVAMDIKNWQEPPFTLMTSRRAPPCCSRAVCPTSSGRPSLKSCTSRRILKKSVSGSPAQNTITYRGLWTPALF